jgi:preprotein translocase subunit SecD
MKKLIYLFVFISIQQTVFSQEKLYDGIYVIDQSEDKRMDAKSDQAAVRFNPFFIDGDPEEYSPIVVFTNDFVPLELAGMPVVQYQRSGENEVLVHLTENAAEKLRAFTAKNMMNHIVVVIDGQAVAVYKVTEPVASSFIKITKCSGGGCTQVYRQLKFTFKP